jgi:quercetin dioxygenase-like cupin family protein
MKKNFILSLLVGFLITGTSPLWAKHHQSIQMPAEDLKWEPNPAKPEEISVAVVWGDMKKGPHAAIHKFKPGTVVENHSHSSTFKGVIIAGTWVTGEESSPKKLGPGSFFMDYKGENHVTKCEGDTECVVYIESSGKFDIKYPKKAKK